MEVISTKFHKAEFTFSGDRPLLKEVKTKDVIADGCSWNTDYAWPSIVHQRNRNENVKGLNSALDVTAVPARDSVLSLSVNCCMPRIGNFWISWMSDGIYEKKTNKENNTKHTLSHVFSAFDCLQTVAKSQKEIVENPLKFSPCVWSTKRKVKLDAVCILSKNCLSFRHFCPVHVGIHTQAHAKFCVSWRDK